MQRLSFYRSGISRLLGCLLSGALGVLVTGHFFQAFAEESKPSSILLPSPDAAALRIYDEPFSGLSDRNQWRIRIFGLRLAALHPLVWGTLKRERTHNRHLVPIKRYFLRASEEQNFEAGLLRAKFRFKGADRRYMEKMPHQKDPVFEIGFGGVFREASMADPPLEDRFYVLRLSAFPPLGSGIFERNLESYQERVRGAVPHLEVGVPYEVEVRFGGDDVLITLNGAEFARLSAPGAARGLITLQTSWHPIELEELSIAGVHREGQQRRDVLLSGLVESKKRS